MAKEYSWRPQEDKGILGSLDEDGVVTFFIVAGEGSFVRGTEMFNSMIEYFGPEVRAIEGVWRQSSAGLPSTNIDKVNELTGAGVPVEEAILQTWTVGRARKLGFVKVRLLGAPLGNPGSYTKIGVLIERESSESG